MEINADFRIPEPAKPKRLSDEELNGISDTLGEDDRFNHVGKMMEHIKAIEAEIVAEREACAKIADAYGNAEFCSDQIADEIRERKTIK